MGTLPWGRSARSALNKVLSSVPEKRQRRLRELVRRVVVGRPATTRVLSNLGSPPPELLTAFEAAFSDSLCLSFQYTDRHGHPSSRVVEAHGLLLEPPAWYLLTRDTALRQPRMFRMFRMDRIRRVRVLRDKPFRPDFEGLKRDYLAQRKK